ncbi:MAG TPA: sigma 54-interacting transcriptional regulator [Bdellovibrionales bacterium]|nr:sigma 54-interacting transcriptional regulator [Bdellovibrionales bacterium]
METQRISENELLMTEAYLIPVSRPGGATFELGEFFTIGREPSNHLVLTDSFVSTRHARIERRAGHFILRDLQSRNGTFLNGSRITEAILTANDRVCFGETVYVFSESLADEAQLSSKNEEWNEQLRRLPAFAATDFPIMISGASGTGKEVLARAIHRHSTRGRGPFVSINCSALSESLIESELFGHVRGSFTGATHDRKGAFETARGGTLFLDEIGDLPISLQPKLLRAIENSEIRPVGSDRAIETDVRILAATHKNLINAIRLGKFREDLFYRLNVCQIRPPSLNERMEDFDDLLYTFAKQHRVRFSFNAIEALKQQPWNGNVRELKNVVARASAYYPGRHIQPEDLERILEPLHGAGPEVQFVHEKGALSPQGSIIKEIEREMIIRRLTANRGNQRRTALDLGMPKSTLHDRIKAYSIDIKKFSDADIENEITVSESGI